MGSCGTDGNAVEDGLVWSANACTTCHLVYNNKES